jgi:oligopeptide transport system permease protein
VEGAVIGLVARRLVAAAAVVLCVASFGFFALRAAPGGPFDRERRLSPSVRRNVEHAYRLDRPLATQYVDYLGGLVRGDLGVSIRRPERVAAVIAEAFPVSLELGLWALLFAVVAGVGLGLIAAAGRDGPADHLARAVALVGISVPAFVLGPLLVFGLALRLDWFPAARWDGAASRVLPAVTLGLAYVGVLARLARASALEGARRDWVRTARAKGVGETAVLLRHAFRPDMLPVVTYLGPAAAGLITGSIVVERIFEVPGLGSALVHSVGDRDYPVLCGIMIFYCLVVVAANLCVDVAVALLDPRTRR